MQYETRSFTKQHSGNDVKMTSKRRFISLIIILKLTATRVPELIFYRLSALRGKVIFLIPKKNSFDESL